MSRSHNPDSATSPRIVILMGVYKGERFLKAQLDSFVEQTQKNWALIVSDDSPDTGSADLISDWHAANSNCDLTFREGPRQGFVRNFLSLLASAPKDADYIALCDQDDVWYPDKLARAQERLSTVPDNVPGLYCAATMICDQDLQPLRPSPPFRRPPGFRNALTQSIGGGNTMLLNRAAADLVATLAVQQADPVAHDWWLYQIISGHGGAILRDDEPVLLYRQHGGNMIGSNTSVRAQTARIRALLNGRFQDWNTRNLKALELAEEHFTDDAKHIIAQFRKARSGRLWERLSALRRSGVFRQSKLGTAAIYAACLMKRL